MEPESETSDWDLYFGGGKGSEKSGEMMEMWDGVGQIEKDTDI